jgi:hypothetical protein
MGVDLAVCPDSWNEGRNPDEPQWHLAYTRLNLERDYALWDLIRPYEKPLPSTVYFNWYADEGLQQRTQNPYGEPLTMVTAGDFATMASEVASTRWNNAVVTMLASLEPQKRIVLWWH